MTTIEPDRSRPTTGSRIPPSSLEAEDSLLGAMLLSADAILTASEFTSVEDFYRPLNGQIFAAIVALSNSGEPIDPVTVKARSEEMGAPPIDTNMLMTLQINCPSPSNAKHYAQLIREKAQQRRLISVAGSIVDEAYNATDDVTALLDDAERRINQIADGTHHETVSNLHDLLLQEVDLLESRFETRGQFNGLATGYRDLDKMLQGLQPTSLTIIGARPAMGKTSFALGILTHVGTILRRPALYFSLEMSAQELAERILSSSALIESSRLRTGSLSDADWTKAHQTFRELSSSKVFIDDNPNLTVMDVRARARRVKQQQGDLGVVIVDYLQLMSSRGKAENRQVEVSEMSRSLKILARELQCPVIALSQLSRRNQERADKRPIMSDLRESGSLEQDADVVIFIHRPEEYEKVSLDQKAEAEIIVAKNRSGAAGTAFMSWVGEYTVFRNNRVEEPI